MEWEVDGGHFVCSLELSAFLLPAAATATDYFFTVFCIMHIGLQRLFVCCSMVALHLSPKKNAKGRPTLLFFILI